MNKRQKVLLNKLEALGVLTGATIAGASTSWILFPAIVIPWGIWRGKRYLNQKRDEVARQKGYRDYQDFLDKY